MDSANEWYVVVFVEVLLQNTVIPQLTSDPANEFFRLTKIFSRCFFWTRVTNMDSANEWYVVVFVEVVLQNTVIPRLTSDPANEFFG